MIKPTSQDFDGMTVDLVLRWVPGNVSCFSLLAHPSHRPHQAQYTNQPTIHECIILGEVSEIPPEFSVTSGKLLILSF